MTIDDKLDIFSNAAIEDALNQSTAIIEEYKLSIEKIYNSRKKELEKKNKDTLKSALDECYREKNKIIAAEQLKVRHRLSKHTEELINLLFNDLLKKLQDFMKTKEYENLLKKQILSAKEFAGTSELTIYLNKTDLLKKENLEIKTAAPLTISTVDFLGGIRAVLPKQNILIDSSFASRINEMKETFTL